MHKKVDYCEENYEHHNCSGRVVVGSFMIECGVELEKNAIPIIINGAVSPAALAIESKIPVIIRGIERGRVTINVA